MQQFYYTSCRSGRSLSGQSGFQIRAASPNITLHQLQAATKHAGYRLPPGEAPSDSTAEHAPVRLAWLTAPGAGRLLCHSVYVGRDPGTRRFGNFFSHLVVNIPSSITWREAIRTWNGLEWRRADDDSSTTLPDRDDLPTGASILAAVKSTLGDEKTLRDALEFVVTVLTDCDENAQIYLALPTSTFAACIAALDRLLPAGCCRSLTFSTYEYDPLNSKAQLVGTSWGNEITAEFDLPGACYDGGRYAMNGYTGRRSHIQADGAFARFAVAALAEGRTQEVDAFCALCAHWQIGDAGLLNAVVRFHRDAASLQPNDFTRLLALPAARAELLTDARWVRRLATWTTTDVAFAERMLPVMLGVSRDVALCKPLVDALHESLVSTIRGERLAETKHLLDTVLPSLTSGGKRAACDFVIDQISEPQQLAWATRAHLLVTFAEAATTAEQVDFDGRLIQWMEGSDRPLSAVATMKLPTAWRTPVVLVAIRRAGSITPEIVTACRAEPALAMNVLEKLTARPEDHVTAVELAECLTDILPLSDVEGCLIGHGTALSSELVEIVFRTFLRRRPQDLPKLVARYGSALAARLAGTSVLAEVADSLCSLSPADNGTNAAVSAFLDMLQRRHTLPTETCARARDWLLLAEVFARPEANLDRLTAAWEALPSLPEETRSATVERLLLISAQSLCYRDVDDAQAVLEKILLQAAYCIGPAPDVYRAFVRHAEQYSRFWKRDELLVALVAVGFGAVRSEELARQFAADPSVEEARDLAEAMALRASQRAWLTLQAAPSAWPDEARRRWTLVAKYFRRPGLFVVLIGRSRLRGLATTVFVVGLAYAYVYPPLSLEKWMPRSPAAEPATNHFHDVDTETAVQPEIFRR